MAADGHPASALVKGADKLFLGQSLTITTTHALEGVLKQAPMGS